MTNLIQHDNGLSNIHPADALADVRAEIKSLQVKEKYLRDKILSRGEDLVGDFHEASVRETSYAKLDEAKLKEALGDLTPYTVEAERVTVYVRLRNNA